MKKQLLIKIVTFIIYLSFCNTASWGREQFSPCKDRCHTYSSQPRDYIYRAMNTCKPVKEEKKTLWDYLSFFGLPYSKRHKIAAEEGNELKLRVRELCSQFLKNSVENIAEEYVVTVSSFVNLNNLYKVSSFGRYFGEQLIGELQMAGVEVIDVRKTPGIMIHQGMGEYSLSRDMSELSYIHSAHAIIVGTYTYTHNQVLINARLLNNQDGLVLSQANLVFELDPLTMELLADESMPSRAGSVVKIQEF